MSLRSRILRLILITLLISLAAGAALTYWHAQKKVRVEMAAAIAVGVNSAREALVAVGRSPEHSRQVRRVVESFNGDRHLQAVWVGPTGSAIAESQLLPPTEGVPDWFFKIFAGETLRARVDLPAKIADLGHIGLATDSHNEVEEIWEDLALKSLIVLSFSAVLMTLVYSVLGGALRPLESLSRALESVGRGDYSAQVPVAGPLELSTIYREFNVMSAQLAESERQNRRLSEQLSRVLEEERADIARDLHDEFGPFLFSIDVDARSIRKAYDNGATQGIGNGADAIRASVAHMQKHLKSILGRLRPSALLDLGLGHALDHLVAFWHSRQPHIAFTLTVERPSFGERIDDTCYRVVQESISNAVRHGKPSAIDICVGLAGPDRLMVEVRDNGCGLQAPANKGFGLAGMRERLAAMNGTLSVGAGTNGGGAVVRAVVPLASAWDEGRSKMSGERSSSWEGEKA